MIKARFGMMSEVAMEENVEDQWYQLGWRIEFQGLLMGENTKKNTVKPNCGRPQKIASEDQLIPKAGEKPSLRVVMRIK